MKKPGIIARIKSAFALVKALRLSAMEDDRGAYDSIREVYRLLGMTPPSEAVGPVKNLTYASIAWRVDRVDAYAACEFVLHQLRDRAENGQLKPESLYLMYYVKAILIQISADQFPGTIKLARSINLNVDDIEIENAPRWIKRRFPMTFELGRSLDAYLERQPTS